MIISLLGYMGCGKSHVSKVLAQKIKFKSIDLDDEISKYAGRDISKIFVEHGELEFRKIEKQTLDKIMQTDRDVVLSLGGGTPAYYNNMDVVTKYSRSIYLRTSVPTLVERLIHEKQKRPLISKVGDKELPEFIAKHLFERCFYYEKSEYIVDTDNKTAEEVSDKIINLLGLHG